MRKKRAFVSLCARTMENVSNNFVPGYEGGFFFFFFSIVFPLAYTCAHLTRIFCDWCVTTCSVIIVHMYVQSCMYYNNDNVIVGTCTCMVVKQIEYGVHCV